MSKKSPIRAQHLLRHLAEQPAKDTFLAAWSNRRINHETQTLDPCARSCIRPAPARDRYSAGLSRTPGRAAFFAEADTHDAASVQLRGDPGIGVASAAYAWATLRLRCAEGSRATTE